ncbi:MAG: urease accessory protein UreJ [Cyanobacteria bacterium QS_8_64_29]|nr:MAG: urease accessory protein UreJ [Cyanobacteria bacterium QS_8_64_29]
MPMLSPWFEPRNRNRARGTTWRDVGVAAATATLSLGFAQQATAHHPYGGTTPDSFWPGLLSGLVHPVIEPERLAFVLLSGLIATGWTRGWVVPLAFVAAALAGTSFHLGGGALPATQAGVALSTVVFGGLLAVRARAGQPRRPYGLVIAGLAALAGLFHGYAYGEAIIGAQMAPLLAYLIGFSLTQLAIALAALAVGNRLIERAAGVSLLRYAGAAASAAGLVFLSAAL